MTGTFFYGDDGAMTEVEVKTEWGYEMKGVIVADHGLTRDQLDAAIESYRQVPSATPVRLVRRQVTPWAPVEDET